MMEVGDMSLSSSSPTVYHVVIILQDIQPLKRFHFGGDEVPGAAYEGSPACQQFKRQNPSIRSSKQLKTYFVRRVAGIASSLGVGLQVYST